MTVYCCKNCGRKIERREDLRSHLHWHKITDPNIESYFTETEQEDEPAVVAKPTTAKPKGGMLGWLRRKPS